MSGLRLDWPWALGVACAAMGLTLAIGAGRRASAPGMAKGLAVLGLALWCLAAGGVEWARRAGGEVAVMVDLSPSTRTAEYRDRAALETRLRQLLGGANYRIYWFADGIAPPDAIAPDAHRLPDLPARQTRYEPPARADATLLFSDGRFAPPAVSAPIYPVIDIGLDDPPDAAITRLDVRGADAIVGVHNAGAERRLELTGVTGDARLPAPPGQYLLTRPVRPGSSVSAQLAPGDPWPENDALSAPAAPPAQVERWLVAAAGASLQTPPGWRRLTPAQLPVEPADYLAPAVIVLDDLPAEAFSPVQFDRLEQYARDLGGGLVLAGGAHAFGAGAYPGSRLEAISPLASSPPRPSAHWMLLADGSGSMNAGGPGESNWRLACDAIVQALPRIPPSDTVSVGSFAESVTWWSSGRSARETAGLPLPPAGAGAHGPTNLRPALETIVADADPAMPNELLLLTDADADVGDWRALAKQMNARRVRLYLLALGPGRGLADLRDVAQATGGDVIRQDRAQLWAPAVAELVRFAEPRRLESTPLAVRFTGPLAELGTRSAAPWNRTWLKAGARGLAQAEQAGERIEPVADWNVGAGRVLSAGFDPTGAELPRLAAVVERRPRDPRFRVEWESQATLRVNVDAVAAGSPSAPATYLNGRSLTLEIAPAGGASGQALRSIPVPQTGPGRYELSLPAPSEPAIATLRDGGVALDRRALAGRYAPEFEAIGNDVPALAELARRSGGALVLPRQMTAIDFRWPGRFVPLSPWLASAGALAMAAALLRWKVG